MSSSNGKMKSNYVSITDQAAISNGTIEVRDADFNIQTLPRDTKEKSDVAQTLSALLGAAGAKADAYYDTEKRKGKN